MSKLFTHYYSETNFANVQYMYMCMWLPAKRDLTTCMYINDQLTYIN